MFAITCRIAIPLILAFSIVPPSGTAATSAYVQTTDGLDINHVRFTIAAPPDFTVQLFQRATALFAKAGLPLPQSDHPNVPFIATLTLTLMSQPVGPICPGQVLYAPSLALTEPVIIPRNSVIINDVTWLAHTGTQVRKPVTILDLERDLDDFIGQFISDYRAANARTRSSISDDTLSSSIPDDAPNQSFTTELIGALTDAALKELHIDQLQLSVLAGRFTQPLVTRALQQFGAAGFSVLPGHSHNSQPTLGLELVQQPLQDRCPGKVLYESGLYLVEPVQLKRNPQVSIWSDTWLRETTHLVSPRSLKQLESDQDALLQQFFDSLNVR